MSSTSFGLYRCHYDTVSYDRALNTVHVHRAYHNGMLTVLMCGCVLTTFTFGGGCDEGGCVLHLRIWMWVCADHLHMWGRAYYILCYSSSPDPPASQDAPQCHPSHHHPNDLTGGGPRVRQWCLWYCVQGEGECPHHNGWSLTTPMATPTRVIGHQRETPIATRWPLKFSRKAQPHI